MAYNPQNMAIFQQSSRNRPGLFPFTTQRYPPSRSPYSMSPNRPFRSPAIIDPLQQRRALSALARTGGYSFPPPDPYPHQSIYSNSLSLPSRYQASYPRYEPTQRTHSDCRDCADKLDHRSGNSYNRGRSSGSHSRCNDCSSSQKFDFKTKDITIRGKARTVRASYLTEAPKFEADLLKYLEKKKDDIVPDYVIDMLVSFINTEDYSNNSPLDEVTLNILASNVGAKSAVDFSIGRLKRMTSDLRTQELTSIVGTVLMSSKVDKGLKEWLKKLLLNMDTMYRLTSNHYWRSLIMNRPEVETEMLRLTGQLPEAEDEGFRLL